MKPLKIGSNTVSEPAMKSYFGNCVKALSGEAYRTIDERLGRLKVNPEVFCGFMVETKPLGVWYDNHFKSPFIWIDFDKWLVTKPNQVKVHAALELEEFYMELSVEQDVIKLLHNPRLEMTPLLRYLIGMFVNQPDEVKEFKQTAIKQLLELPWYAEVFHKFKQFFPVEVKQC